MPPLLFLMALASCIQYFQLTFGQSTSGSSCSAVLEAGVYNTWSTSGQSASFSQVQNALCTSYSGYTFSQYQLDRANLDAEILSGSVSQATASAYCNSQASSFDVAAQASFAGFGGGGSYGQSQSSSSCGSNSDSSNVNSYSSSLSQSSYNLATTNINAYQQSSCGSSNDLSSSSGSVQNLTRIIDPTVYSAYTACLNLYKAGIQYSQTSAYDQSILTIDIIYIPEQGTGAEPVQMYGFNTTGSVTCALKGPGIDPSSSAATTLVTPLQPNTDYTVVCQLDSTSVRQGTFSDIFFYTSPGGTFHGLLFNEVVNNTNSGGAPSAQLDALQAQITLLQNQQQKLLSNILEVNATGNTQISNLNSYLAAVNNTATSTPPTGTILPFAGSEPPSGCLICDGSAVSRTTYANLYNVIGGAYGTGDGSSTFNVPDLRGRSPLGSGAGAGLTSRSLGSQLGEENHQLSVGEMPSHSHGVNDPGHSHGLGNVVGNILQGQVGDPGRVGNCANGIDTAGVSWGPVCGSNPNVNVQSTGISLQGQGSSGSHNTIHPSLVVNFIIKT